MREVSGISGLSDLNRVRSVKILGQGEIPPVAFITAQEKKLWQLRLDKVFEFVGEYPDALARTRVWAFGGHRICTLISGVGGASLDRILVSAVLRGVRLFVRLGTAGLVRQGAPIGVIVVPTEVRSDCTVYWYYRRALEVQGKLGPRQHVRPNPDLLRLVREGCIRARLGEPQVSFGRVFSTALIMHESPAVVRKYQHLGCVAADMETAPLMAGAAYFGIPAVAIHVGSDHMLGGEHHSAHGDAFQSGVDRLHALLSHFVPNACGLAAAD